MVQGQKNVCWNKQTNKQKQKTALWTENQWKEERHAEPLAFSSKMMLQCIGRHPVVSWEAEGTWQYFLLYHDLLLFVLKKHTPSAEKAIPEHRGPNKEIALDSLAKSVAIYILSIIRNCNDNRKREHQRFLKFLLQEIKDWPKAISLSAENPSLLSLLINSKPPSFPFSLASRFFLFLLVVAALPLHGYMSSLGPCISGLLLLLRASAHLPDLQCSSWLGISCPEPYLWPAYLNEYYSPSQWASRLPLLRPSPHSSVGHCRSLQPLCVDHPFLTDPAGTARRMKLGNQILRESQRHGSQTLWRQ